MKPVAIRTLSLALIVIASTAAAKPASQYNAGEKS